ncbi:Endoglucanase [Castilleja foliolosa]|uniref:Endoglucanase n=1 Tax=Castilleja foliolosa TaxID=1961234 RepID=A0ABD3BNZ0_9LAMI
MLEKHQVDLFTDRVGSWNNMQFVTTASFLTTVYSDYLASAGKSLTFANKYVSPSDLLSFAKSQVEYILGDNPRATSYMVGYGENYPHHVHHRGSSIVSYKVDPTFVSCRGGYGTLFNRKASDPNLLAGAIVGGPDVYNNFVDRRDNYEQTKPTTYNNALLIGVLTRLNVGQSGYTHQVPASSTIAIDVSQKVTAS